MNATQGTLALEKLVTDPRFPQIAAALAKELPAHIADQFDAAETQVADGFNLIGELMGGPPTCVTVGDMAGWLRLEVLSRINALVSGTVDTCLHSPSPLRPEPLFAAACKPNLITCHRCIHLLNNPPGGKADNTCDGCGHVCAGPVVDDGIHPCVSRYGLLTFTYGVCGNCRVDMGLSSHG